METIKNIPIHILSAGELLKYANLLKITNFRGVFMYDTLPNRIWYSETGVVNLDSIFGSGTHWVCYSKILSKLTTPVSLYQILIGKVSRCV